MKECEKKISANPLPIPAVMQQAYRNAYTLYHQRVLEEKIKLLPEAADTFEKDLQQAIKNMETYT
jgi:hypothetical protein